MPDRFQRESQTNRTGRAVGFGGGRVGFWHIKTGDDRHFEVRFRQASRGGREMAFADGAELRLGGNQAPHRRVPANECIQFSEQRIGHGQARSLGKRKMSQIDIAAR